VIGALTSSVLVSALTAFMAFGATQVWRRWHLGRLRQLCSLDGAFITEYERDYEGTIVRHRALTQISQIGLRVRGVTTELGSERSWELDGEIDRFGFLRGVEKTLGADGTAFTTVLLAISDAGDALTGLWSGCGSVERQVSSGQYVMRRCEQPSVSGTETSNRVLV
jgi:hypothetical protein